MKVLIELDDDVFKDIRESNFDSARAIVRNFQATITDAIRNGTTERNVGKWILSRPGIYTCSICGLDASAGEVNHQGYVYCPKCGNRVER